MDQTTDQAFRPASAAQPASIEEALRLLRPLGRDSVSGRAWAMVAAELERLCAIEQRASEKANAPRRLDGAASWDVARHILGEA